MIKMNAIFVMNRINQIRNKILIVDFLSWRMQKWQRKNGFSGSSCRRNSRPINAIVHSFVPQIQSHFSIHSEANFVLCRSIWFRCRWNVQSNAKTIEIETIIYASAFKLIKVKQERSKKSKWKKYFKLKLSQFFFSAPFTAASNKTGGDKCSHIFCSLCRKFSFSIRFYSAMFAMNCKLNRSKIIVFTFAINYYFFLVDDKKRAATSENSVLINPIAIQSSAVLF